MATFVYAEKQAKTLFRLICVRENTVLAKKKAS
jgi:hypothetical protein